MFVRFIAHVLALGLATLILPGVELTSGSRVSDITALFVVAVIFGIVNSAVKPIFRFASKPLWLVLLGLALLVVNAGLLLLTSWVCSLLNLPWNVDGFESALIGGLIVAVISFLVNSLFGVRGEHHR